MAQQGAAGRQTDEYGNPAQRVGGIGADQHAAGTGGGIGTKISGGEKGHETHGAGGIRTKVAGAATGLRRSGSSSSSSSEDDGEGGRRKKGMKEKIAEKLPGGHRKAEEGQVGGVGKVRSRSQEHEKKGVVEKVKEKLPGGTRQ